MTKTVTVYIVGAGTGTTSYANPPNGSISPTGHMYIKADDDADSSPPRYAGFAPEGGAFQNPSGSGYMYQDDNQRYQNTQYQKVITLTDAQYEDLNTYLDNPFAHGFDPNYGLINNNCIKFVWDALEAAGLPSAPFDGVGFTPAENAPMLDALFPENPIIPPGGNNVPACLIPAGGLLGQAPSVTPLVLDLDGDGIETTRLGYGATASSTYFDLDNDGFAERTGWVTGGDGLLAIDLNNNGRIDNQSELFGNSASYADGFAALSALDTNSNNKITSSDTAWSSLKVWVDANNNGVTDAGELKSLASLNITEIGLNSTPQTNLYNNENTISATSTFVIGGVSREVADVWFRNDSADTRYLGGHTLIEEAFSLPTLKGTGSLKNLHVALSQDSTLLGMVEDLVTNWSPANFLDAASLDQDIENILFRWAGVESVSTTSRGPHVDGQVLAFMEILFGSPYGGVAGTNPAGLGAGNTVADAYIMAFDALKAQLIVQAGGYSLFEQWPIYNVVSGELSNATISSSSISILQTQASGATDKAAYWTAVGTFLLNVKPAGDFSSAEKMALDSAIQATDNSLSWTSMVSAVLSRYPSLALNGSEFSDQLAGSVHNDSIIGHAGDDHLDGRDGHDSIDGGSGDDALEGGTGNDTLSGGEGNDTYFFDVGFGEDTISDAAGADKIKFGAGITLANLRFSVDSNTLTIYSGSDQITLYDHFYDRNNSTNYYDEVEQIVFADNSTFDLSGNFTFIGTSSSEYVYGTNGNDTIIGLTGGDGLVGGSGNDTYIFDAGFGEDTISDTAGADKINFGAGIALNNLRFSVTGDALTIYSGSDQITLYDHFYDRNNSTNYHDEVEQIVFADNSTFDLSGNFTFIGTSSSEYVYGTNGNDTIIGLTGGDGLVGGSGNDTYFFDAGFGEDTISDTAGADTIRLGSGLNTENISVANYSTWGTKIIATAGSHEITITNQRDTSLTERIETLQFSDGFKANLLTYSSWVWGTSSAQTTTGTANADTIFGRGGNDTINGNNGNDAIHGGSGTDTITGGNGNDQLHGGVGNDNLNGNADADILFGGDGLDTLTGSTGADRFVFTSDSAFNNIDIITDFSTSQLDKIDLSDLLQQYDPLTEAITDFLQITTSGSNSLLKVDVDGGGNSFVRKREFPCAF